MLAHSPLLLSMVLLSVATMAAYNVAGRPDLRCRRPDMVLLVILFSLLHALL